MSEVTSVKTDVDVEVLKKIPKNELGLDYFVSFDFAQFDANLENFLKAGVHFGHLKSRRHPKMDEYIYTTRKNINIFNLEKTMENLVSAAKFLSSVAKSGQPILFVGMKKQTQNTIKSLALRLGESYVVDRWLGGTLTNFSHIRARARYLNETDDKLKKGEFKKYTKFEQVRKNEEVERLEKKVGGVRHMEKLPGAIVIADVKEAGLVIREAKKMRVPVVGITDSDANPSNVDYPIPGNDDALSSLRFLLSFLGKAVLEAKDASDKKETSDKSKEASVENPAS